MDADLASSIKGELLELGDTLARVRRWADEGKLTAAEAQGLRERVADYYAERIVRLLCPPAERSEGGQLLVDFGVEPLTAEQLAAQCSLSEIAGWIAYASRSRGLSSPAGLVVARLRDRVPAPRPPDDLDELRRRYLCEGDAEYGEC